MGSIWWDKSVWSQNAIVGIQNLAYFWNQVDVENIIKLWKYSINIPWIEKLTIQNWNLQGFKIIYSTQLQVHWISVLILTSWCITKDLKQGLLKLKIAAANCFESTKTAQRYVKGRLISKCPFGVFKSSKKLTIFSRISALASKKRSNQKSSVRESK